MRGVEPVALQVHDEVTIVEGRMFQPSSSEAIVGSGVAGRYVGAKVGDTLAFGRGHWKVVGRFDSGGSSFESEVWADVRELAADAKRTIPYSGAPDARRRRRRPATRSRAASSADPRYALEATPEPEYYEKQAESANALYFIVVGLAVLAGIGAAFGATNTLYAAVQSRRAEIGTLRALGFSRTSIVRVVPDRVAGDRVRAASRSARRSPPRSAGWSRTGSAASPSAPRPSRPT